MKRGNSRSDQILGLVSSESAWRRSIMICMELHGFVLCIKEAMAVGVDEIRRKARRRIQDQVGWTVNVLGRSFWKKRRIFWRKVNFRRKEKERVEKF